jgi:hypothetical protein
MLKPGLVLGLAAAAGVAGCQDSSVLYVASHSVVGVNAAVNTAQTSGHLMIGYDRIFVTNPPKSVTIANKPGERESMAVLSCSEVIVTGIFLTSFREHLATGQAATDFAGKIKSDPNNSNEFFKCSTASTTTTTTTTTSSSGNATPAPVPAAVQTNGVPAPTAPPAAPKP